MYKTTDKEVDKYLAYINRREERHFGLTFGQTWLLVALLFIVCCIAESCNWW